MRKFCAVVMLFLITGCASVGKIENSFKAIDYTDGVDAVEAKQIAQKYILGHPARTHFGVSTVTMYRGISGDYYKQLSGEAWFVYFPTRDLLPLSPYYMTIFLVAIDKKTGYLRHCSIDKLMGGIPVEYHAYGKEGIPVE